MFTQIANRNDAQKLTITRVITAITWEVVLEAKYIENLNRIAPKSVTRYGSRST